MAFDISKIAGGSAQWQALIDAQIAQRRLGQYIEYARYIPQGKTAADVAPDNTHVLALTSTATGEAVTIAIKGKGIYSTLLDALLRIV
jgi:hypothetical protein